MKRILSLFLFAVICVASHAEWIETAETDFDVYYVNDNITKDASGYYMVWVKQVPKTNVLAKRRNEYYRKYKKRKYLKYTHTIDLEKIDIYNNRVKCVTITDYASKESIDTVNTEYVTDWEYPIPDSAEDSIMIMAKAIIAYQENDY